MTPPVEKLVSLERKISAEKGPFALFALFLREDAPDTWDVVVSAPWIDAAMQQRPEEDPLYYLADQFRSSLNTEELLSISRIVPIETGDSRLEAVQRAVQRAISTEHNSVEVKDSVFFGLKIRHAYIVTSKRQNDSATETATHAEAAHRKRTPRKQ